MHKATRVLYVRSGLDDQNLTRTMGDNLLVSGVGACVFLSYCRSF